MTAVDRIVNIREQRAARADGLPPAATYNDALAVLADLPAALLHARAWRGSSQPEAARQIGVSKRTWWMWESGRKPPNRFYAIALLEWVRDTHLLPDRRGWCVNGRHLLAEVGVYRSPSGGTCCRGCSRERERERKRRRRAAR